MPLLGLLACLCLHFPCERPRPSLNRSPVTASRAPYQQASCYPKSKAGPAQNPHLLLHHSPLDQLQGRSEHLRLFGRARTDTNIPPQTTPSDPNCFAPLAPHLLNHCTVAVLHPDSCVRPSSCCFVLFTAFAAHLRPPPPFAAPLAGPFGIAGENPRIACLSSAARPLNLRPSWRAEWYCTNWWCWEMVVLVRRP